MPARVLDWLRAVHVGTAVAEVCQGLAGIRDDKSGVWRLIKALSGLDGRLNFAAADMEKAVHIYMPDAEPSKVVVEAKQLLGLLSGWRRVIRHGAVPDPAAHADEQQEAQAELGLGVLLDNWE